jgi:hypothetical protein
MPACIYWTACSLQSRPACRARRQHLHCMFSPCSRRMTFCSSTSSMLPMSLWPCSELTLARSSRSRTAARGTLDRRAVPSCIHIRFKATKKRSRENICRGVLFIKCNQARTCKRHHPLEEKRAGACPCCIRNHQKQHSSAQLDAPHVALDPKFSMLWVALGYVRKCRHSVPGQQRHVRKLCIP